jgi:hypothetical protein
MVLDMLFAGVLCGHLTVLHYVQRGGQLAQGMPHPVNHKLRPFLISQTPIHGYFHKVAARVG